MGVSHRIGLGLVAASIAATVGPSPQTGVPPSLLSASTVTMRMTRLPLRFEANAGQWDDRVRFRARGNGTTVFVTDRGMTIALLDIHEHHAVGEAVVTINLRGAVPASLRGEGELT